MTTRKLSENRMRNTAKIATIMVVQSREFYGRPLKSHELDAISVMAEEIAFRLPEDVDISDIHKHDVEAIIAYIDFKARLPADPTVWQRIKYWWKHTPLEKRARLIINWTLIAAAIILLIIGYTEVL